MGSPYMQGEVDEKKKKKKKRKKKKRKKKKRKKKNLSCCCQLKWVACVHAKSVQQVRVCLCVQGDVVLGEMRMRDEVKN